MATTATKKISANFGNVGKETAVNSATFDLPIGPALFDLPAGKAVTSWVKTDANTAACDLPSGHGYTNGNFDVYWTATGVNYVRYGVPGTISTNALTLDGGAGTDFPDSATSGVVVCKRVEIEIVVTGDNIEYMALILTNTSDTGKRGHLDFYDDGPTSVYAATIEEETAEGGLDHVINVQANEDNPLASEDVVKLYATNSSTSAAAILTIYFGVDATP